MDVRAYTAPLLKWWWLLLLAFGIAVGTSYYVEKQQPPIYKTATTLLIGRINSNPNPSNNDFWLSQQLASLYADIAKRDPVRNAAMANLGLKTLPLYDVRPLPNSQLLEIAVTDADPVVTYRVATELANQLILQSPSSLQPTEQARQVFIQQQIDVIQKDILNTQDAIAKKQDELGKLTSAKDIADTQLAIQTFETKLSLLQTNFTNLVASTQNGASNTLSVIDPAIIPTVPIGPNKLIIVGIAGLLGLLIAGGAAFLLEYLDDSLEAPEDVSFIQGLPVVGLIAVMDKNDPHRPFVLERPRSMIGEAFRSLRTNLELSHKQVLRTIFLTSPEPGDGKTSIAANLAVVFAQGGKRVVLLDADLRNPKVHETFGIENINGLGEILTGKADLINTLQSVEDDLLTIIPAGDTSKLPLEALEKKKAQAILKQLTQIADIVIIDGTPLFVSDALLWSTIVDGVLLVVRPGHTRKSAFRVMIDQMDRTGSNVLGVIFNRIRIQEAGAYGRFQYYSSYYNPKSESKGEGLGKEKHPKKGKVEPVDVPISRRN